MAKDKDYRRLIHSNRWIKLRRAKLTACPLCEDCKETGRITPATEVHHIKPVEDALNLVDKESLMFDIHPCGPGPWRQATRDASRDSPLEKISGEISGRKFFNRPRGVIF